mmetsp:Transcript_62699/g.101420  ORF Transcript_62699/g.101420 Transcript_62699/m.101420 type:complete len:212 (+) Transcript_62699:734-1369(+)
MTAPSSSADASLRLLVRTAPFELSANDVKCCGADSLVPMLLPPPKVESLSPALSVGDPFRAAAGGALKSLSTGDTSIPMPLASCVSCCRVVSTVECNAAVFVNSKRDSFCVRALLVFSDLSSASACAMTRMIAGSWNFLAAFARFVSTAASCCVLAPPFWTNSAVEPGFCLYSGSVRLSMSRSGASFIKRSGSTSGRFEPVGGCSHTLPIT